MNFYIVGGAVRDAMLGQQPHDYDIVVEGATPEKMKELGFISVGKAFPVFLHPVTKDEFALCRKEIKTGPKHTDFEFVWDNVTLKEDLERRDFTMNALACPCDVDIKTGKVTPITLNKEKLISNCYIIDEHAGFGDIHNRVIRCVNPIHFIEDPLRVLRACRFAAQLEFEISRETMSLMQKMVADGMLDHLSRERIEEELFKAMQPGCHSEVYIMKMKECGALKQLYPEIYALFDNKENIIYHSTGNTGLHVMAALRCIQQYDVHQKMGVLHHDIYKPLAYNTDGPNRRHDTDEAIQYFEEMCKNKVYSHKIKQSIETSIRYHMRMWQLFDGMTVNHFVDMLGEITHDYKEDYEYLLKDLLITCAADDCSDKTEHCIQKGQTNERCKLLQIIAMDVFDICKAIRFRDVPDYQNKKIEVVKDKQREMRISAVKKYFKSNNYNFRPI